MLSKLNADAYHVWADNDEMVKLHAELHARDPSLFLTSPPHSTETYKRLQTYYLMYSVVDHKQITATATARTLCCVVRQ